MIACLALRPVVFEIQARLPNIGNALKWPQNYVKHLTAKSSLYIINAWSWDPNFGLFQSTCPAVVFVIQGCRESEMNRVTSEWPHTFKCQKCFLPAPIALSDSLYGRPLSRYKRLLEVCAVDFCDFSEPSFHMLYALDTQVITFIKSYYIWKLI